MKVHKDYRGELDLEMRIEQLTKRIKDLEDINEGHRKLNGELRVELESSREVIRRLTNDIHNGD